jgi:hypothetical protein
MSRRLLVCYAAWLAVLWFAGAARAQTAEELTTLMARLHDLGSIDLCQFGVKYRSGLEPSLAAVDADESAMGVLKNPFEAQGQGKPGAAGWYRVSFVIPDKVGRFKPSTTDWVIECNVQGTAELYAYQSGKPARIDKGFTTIANQAANSWVKTTLKDSKSGDKITLVILATSFPWGRGSPEGFALRHLRLGKRTSGAHDEFFRALFNVREKLSTLKGDELKKFRAKVNGPLAGLDAVFAAADRDNVGLFIDAMVKATKPLSDSLKK